MGLDMYLFVKRPHETGKGLSTGACGGLFGIVPDIGDGTEIGYWRKFYELDSFLGHSEDEFELTREEVENALEFVQDHLVAFDEGKDLDWDEFYDTYGFEPADEWDRYKWEDSVGIFENALKLMDTEDAKVFYCRWY